MSFEQRIVFFVENSVRRFFAEMMGKDIDHRSCVFKIRDFVDFVYDVLVDGISDLRISLALNTPSFDLLSLQKD